MRTPWVSFIFFGNKSDCLDEQCAAHDFFAANDSLMAFMRYLLGYTLLLLFSSEETLMHKFLTLERNEFFFFFIRWIFKILHIFRAGLLFGSQKRFEIFATKICSLILVRNRASQENFAIFATIDWRFLSFFYHFYELKVCRAHCFFFFFYVVNKFAARSELDTLEISRQTVTQTVRDVLMYVTTFGPR